VLLVQFLVLAFTGVLWWLARRDLSSRPAPPPAVPADTRELEQLCITLEALVTDLAGRLEAVERGLERPVGAPLAAPSSEAASAASAAFHPARAPSLASPAEPEAAAHAALSALLSEGVTDPAEIARRTGLGRGEVDLILSLRARRAF